MRTDSRTKGTAPLPDALFSDGGHWRSGKDVSLRKSYGIAKKKKRKKKSETRRAPHDVVTTFKVITKGGRVAPQSGAPTDFHAKPVDPIHMRAPPSSLRAGSDTM